MMMRMLVILMMLAVGVIGCDEAEPTAAAQSKPAEKAASREVTAAKPQAAADPMARLAHKGLYSRMDPMVVLRSWDDVAKAAAPGGSGVLAVGDLPAGEGREVTFALCGACHSMKLVVQQRLPEHRWDELWTWMIQTQGMPDPGPELKKQIVTYLKTNFAS